MALTRWEPVPMNRLFNNLFDTPTAGFGSVKRSWIPALDIVENDDDYVLRADLPGLTEQDINVELHNDVLTVSGERKSEHEERKQGYHRVERSSGSFRRSVRLPEGVSPESVRATFERGVLEVTVPKPEQQGPHKVQITAGEGDSAPVAEVESPAVEPDTAA
jgi:HSP20 family protein